MPGTLYNNTVLDIAEPIEDNKNWDVAGEHGPIKKLSFTTSEGTWISLDISPDGREIIFDLLGDLYTMPISGGVATPLTSGPSWDIQDLFTETASSMPMRRSTLSLSRLLALCF